MNNTTTGDGGVTLATGQYHTIFALTLSLLILLVFFTLHLNISYIVYMRSLERLRKANVLMVTTLVSTCLYAGGLCCNVAVLLVPYMALGADACRFATNATTSLYCCGYAGVELFFWLRQRFLYADPMLKRLQGTRVRTAQAASLAAIFLSKAGNLLTTGAWRLSPLGCVEAVDQAEMFIPGFVAQLLDVGTHLLLFFLFQYALSKSRSACTSAPTVTSARVLRLLTAARLCCGINTAAVVIFSGFAYVVSQLGGELNVLTGAAFSLCNFLHLLTCVVSYSKTNVILASPYRKRRRRRPASSSCGPKLANSVDS